MTSSHVLPPGSPRGRDEGLGGDVWKSGAGWWGEGVRVQSQHLGPCFPWGLGRCDPRANKLGLFVCCEVAKLEYGIFYFSLLVFVLGEVINVFMKLQI